MFTEYEKAALSWYIETGRAIDPSMDRRERIDKAVAVLEFNRGLVERQLARMPPKPCASSDGEKA